MRIVAFLVFFAAQIAFCEVSVQNLNRRINQIVNQSGVPKSQIGLWVGHKGQKIFSLNGEEKFIPASVSKILPAATTLSKVRSNHKFETYLYIDGTIDSEKTLNGNLYLVGGGDPSFTSEDMWMLVNHFTREGIVRITGDIIVDDERFDETRFDPGRDEDGSDRDKSYTAPVGAMSFNWNSVNIIVRPGKGSQKSKVFVNPENDYIEIINRANTRSGSGNSLSVTRLGLRFTDQGEPKDTILIQGSIGRNLKEASFYRNITRPDYWAGANLKSFLKQRGINVEGMVKDGVVPRNAKKLVTYEGRPLHGVASDMMKFSNNYLAEMLTKNLAFLNDRKPRATMDEGLEVIRLFLDKKGIKRGDYELTSPSGLSRKNKFRPKDIHNLLEDLRLNMLNFPEYLAAQAVSGTDGTLKNRMQGGSVKGRIRAKTGTLSGVVGLAGYAMRADGEVITFAFLYNGSVGVSRPRRLFDNISTALLNLSL